MREVSSVRRKKRRFRLKKGTVFVLFLLVLILTAILLSRCESMRVSMQKQQYPIKYQEIVEEYAKEFGVDKYLVYSVIKAESKFDQYAVSGAGARGLMQLQDETAKECAAKLNRQITVPDDLYDPDTNIMLGCYYLSHLTKLFDGDVEKAVMAYNGGPGNVSKWLNDETLSDGKGGLSTIPFGETENYVKNVMSAYQTYKKLYQKTED